MPMRWRWRLFAALIALGVIAAALFLVRARPLAVTPQAAPPGPGAAAAEPSRALVTGDQDGDSPSPASARARIDRSARDALRQAILAAWADAAATPPGERPTGTDTENAAAPAPMPTRHDGTVDPDYIQSVFRQDMLPMARSCFEELLSRQPDAGGRIELGFTILADEKLGGVVDDVTTDGGAPDAIHDDPFDTCMRESLSTLSFRPPPHGGSVTVVYPLVFSDPGDHQKR
jgi:hypothetical protein